MALLKKVSSRIINEVRGINRVTYDVIEQAAGDDRVGVRGLSGDYRRLSKFQGDASDSGEIGNGFGWRAVVGHDAAMTCGRGSVGVQAGSTADFPGAPHFVGSLASTSINRLLAKALVRLAPPELVLSEIPIKDLPLYSSDYDADYPPVARAFKQAIADVDAVLFVTPEYNRSIPGGLKNAIDWASRPWGKNSFARKPSGVIGTSPGAIGTAVAQQSLRGVLCFCNSPLMNQVEAYIQFKTGLITADGEVTDDSTKQFLQNYMTELHAFIVRVLTVLPRNA